MDYHEDPDTGPTHKEQAYIDQRDAALAQRDAALAEVKRLAAHKCLCACTRGDPDPRKHKGHCAWRIETERDAALALLRRLVVSIRLGSIDEAAVREAGRIVGEDADR